MAFYMIYSNICLHLLIFLPNLYISPFIHKELRAFKCFPLPLIDVMMFGILRDTQFFFKNKFIKKNFVLKNHCEFRTTFCSPTTRSPMAVWLVLGEETCHSTANFSVPMFSQPFWGRVRKGPLMLMLKLKYKQEIVNSP